MKKIILSFFFLVLVIGFSSAANVITDNTIFAINGLPNGSYIFLRFSNDSFQTHQYNITSNYTILPFNFVPFSGNTEQYQMQGGSGGGSSTVEYKGVTYALIPSTYTQTITDNQINVLSFFSFLNLSQWYLTEANQLIAQGVSKNSLIINDLTQSAIDALLATNSTGTNTITNRIIVSNVVSDAIYGGIKTNSGYQQAGNVLKYVLFNNQTGILNLVTANIIKNHSYICLNLTSSIYSQSLCDSGVHQFQIPELFGHFGLKFSDTLTSILITAKLQSSLIGSQTAPFNALINVAGNNILLSSLNTTNSLSITKTFIYSVGQSLNITLDGLGNSNYSAEDPTFITPTGVKKVLNVSLNNQQTNTITAGTQIMLTFNGFNYNSQFNGNTINLEIFNGITGNILYSEFMGNQNQANQIAGFNGIQDNNDIIFVSLPDKIKNGNAVNVISIGFLGMSSTALNANNMGIRPDIFCTGAGNCPQTYYGQFDDGLNVFNTVYTNFVGTSCPSIFTCGGGATVNNGITFFDNNAMNSISLFNPQNNILEGLGNFITSTRYQQFAYFNTVDANAIGVEACSGQTCSAGTGNYNIGTIGTTPNDLLISTGNPLHILSTIETPSNIIGGLDYSLKPYITPGNYASQSQAFIRLTFAATAANNMFLQYLYLRQMPPSDIMPVVTFGSIQAGFPMGTPNVIMSNTFINQGQSILFTANVIGGIAPYSYSYNVYATNSGSVTLIANQLYNGNSIPRNTFLWTPNNLYIGNTLFFANVVIIDSTPTNGVVNSISNSFGYNSAPTLTITPSCGLCSTASTETYTFNVIGGTGPFQGILSSGPLIGLTPSGNIIILTPSTTNTQSFLTQTVGTFQYNGIIIDYGTTTNVLFNSILNQITVTAQTSGGPGGGPSPSTCPSGSVNITTGECNPISPIITLPSSITNKTVICQLSQFNIGSAVPVISQCLSFIDLILLHSQIKPLNNYQNLAAQSTNQVAKNIYAFSFTPIQFFLFVMIIASLYVYFKFDKKHHKFIASSAYFLLALGIIGTIGAFFV